MKRKHKTYSRPKRPFDKVRIEEEGKIKEEFGLKNKTEIWKAEARVKDIRGKAKRLIKSSAQDQKVLFEKLQKLGFKVNSIGEALSLDKKDYLNKRLQTIVAKKKIAPTIKSARQLITHRKILVDGRVVDSPSYIIPVDLENKIAVRKTNKIKVAQKMEAEE